MLKIFPEGLAVQLNKTLAPLYLLTGQDLLLVGECKDLIVKAARQAGFDEKTEIDLDNVNQWEAVIDSVQSVGLFSQQQIIIVNLPDNFLVAQQKKLAELLSYANADLLFILHLPKFSKATEKQAWYQAASGQLVQINCQTPDIARLPQWIENRAKAIALNLDNDAVQLLAFSYEGNLLALNQALELLRLRYPADKIGLSRVKEVVKQSAQFTPYQWLDALLEGKIKRATRILQHLKDEEMQPVILLRIVQKELATLLEITRSPQPINTAMPLYAGNLRQEFDRLKVWQNRRGIYQQVVMRLTYGKLFMLIRTLAEIERKVKQEFSDDIWREFERLALLFH